MGFIFADGLLVISSFEQFFVIFVKTHEKINPLKLVIFLGETFFLRCHSKMTSTREGGTQN